MIGFVASSSIEPKYAAPPANPARTHGMVNACERKKKEHPSHIVRNIAWKMMIKLTISHFRFPRRIARYSDQGRVFWVPCDTSVDLRRIEDNTFFRELNARILLRDMQ
jgi:hypothetical protein